MFENIKRGVYEVGEKQIYFRSEWEWKYACYLEFLKKHKEIKNWTYETDKFVFDKIQFGTRSYLPDFKVILNNGSVEYHEVKGYMDSRSKTKLKRMKKYYPKVKIVLIEKDWFTAIKKKKQDKLLGW